MFKGSRGIGTGATFRIRVDSGNAFPMNPDFQSMNRTWKKRTPMRH